MQTKDATRMTWKQFLRLVNEKYLGEIVHSEKMQEFITLSQGRLLVAKYATKFEELA